MKFLLITPPLTQLNTPYPATAVLKGYLQGCGYEVAQTDMGIEMVDRMMRADWLRSAARWAADHRGGGRVAGRLLQAAVVVEPVMRFLRGQDETLAWRIVNGSLLPEGRRKGRAEDMEWAFGTAGIADRARYMATLFLEEVAEALQKGVDEHFGLVNYAEQVAAYAPTFDELHRALNAQPSPMDLLMGDLLMEHLKRERPDVVCFSVPFPGCLYGALRCGGWIKQGVECVGVSSRPRVCIGGGFVNTEWRQLQDERVFDYCDFVTLDDGELPLRRIGEFVAGQCSGDDLVRTMWRKADGTVVWEQQNCDEVVENGVPDFDGLPLHLYLSTADMTNPMHRLWSDGRWNKLMMAHGCYWHRCAFCDTGLDYIGRFATPTAAHVVDTMESVARQTGVWGFHFVDEALPPRLLGEVCDEIIGRGLTMTFWGNIRFEKAYTAELCNKLARAGCVAVSGGLEVASDRLLKLMEKGVTIEQTVEACRHFRDAGIMVHTYLMYGFPTETLQETLGALDTVRQMFDEGIVQSAFWHRYAMTCHSPSGRNPERYGARRCPGVDGVGSEGWNPFCNNEVDWEPIGGGEQFDYDIEEVGRGLRTATYNYMNGLGLDQPVRSWFPGLRVSKQNKRGRR
ncbi:MAG: radical SAM protein [Bacteroidales bacterium]|nr:radical SAM protein [Bacteroidales bacterium]